MHYLRSFIVILAWFLTLPVAGQAPAGGTLDAGFGTGGRATLALGAYDLVPTDLALAADGSLFLLATREYPDALPRYRQVVVKLTSAGAVDGTYGTAGVVELLAMGDVQCGRLHWLPDGSLRVVASSGTMKSWALDATGAVLTSYGTGGMANTEQAVNCLTGSALTADQGLLLLGYHASGAGAPVQSYVVRLTSAGGVDASFGTNGVLTLAADSQDCFGREIVLLSGGSFLVGLDHGAALASEQVARGCSLLRFSSAGVLDSSFNSAAGVPVTELTRLQGMRVNSANGRITLLGQSSVGSGLVVVRRLANGAVDHTFSLDGVSSQSAGAVSDAPAGLALISDGSTYLANTVGQTSGTDFQLLRLGALGERDLSFNSTGDVITSVGVRLDTVSGIKLQPDGKLLLYGAAELSAGQAVRQPAVLRYHPSTLGAVSTLSFTTQPQGTVLDAGTALNLTAVMNLSHPGLYFQWKRGATVVAGGFGLASLQISAVTVADEGSYTVEVRDGTSEVVSDTATVVVDAPPEFILQPMSQTVVAGSYVSFSVTASGRAPFTYTVLRDGSSVATGSSATGSLLYEPSLAGSYTFTFTNADGSDTSDAAVLTLLPNPPTVQAEPQSVAALTGSDCSFSVTASGLSPYTFQWMKDGADVGTATTQAGATHTLSLTGVTALQQGAYQCRITNLGGAVTTQVAWLDVGAEGELRVLPANQLVSEGAALRLRTALFTSATGSFTRQWTKNNLPVPDTGPELVRPAASFTDAANYRSTATQLLPAGRILSNTVRVAVVGSSAQTLVVAQGRNVTLSIRTAGTGLLYAWQKNGIPLAPVPPYSGVSTAALTLTGVQAEDAGVYTCLVTAPWGQTLSSGAQTLTVATAPPSITASTLPTGQVATSYSYQIPISGLATRFTVTGLPPGLSCDASTGRISGATGVAGSFTVRMMASNPMGSSAAVTAVLVVAPLPDSLAGHYTGLIGDGTAGPHLGSYVLTITPNGSYTGKATVGAHTGALAVLAFNGQLAEPALGVRMYESTSSTVTLPSFMAGGAGAHFFRFSLNAATQELRGSLARVASRSFTPLSSYRNPWDALTRPASKHAAYYTTTLRYPALDGAAGGLGVGYCGITAKLDGSYTLTGKLPEGTAFTSSGIFSQSGGLWLQSWLYQNRGSVAGQLDLVNEAETSYTDTRVTGQLYWTRPASPQAAAFPVEGNALHTGVKNVGLTVLGARYLPPDTPHMASPLMMNLPPNPALSAPQAEVRLTVDATQGDDGLVDASHRVSFSGLTTDAFQPRALTFTPATGFFTGSVFYQPANRSFPIFGVVVSDSFLRTARAEGSLLETYPQAVTGGSGVVLTLPLQQTRRVDFIAKP